MVDFNRLNKRNEGIKKLKVAKLKMEIKKRLLELIYINNNAHLPRYTKRVQLLGWVSWNYTFKKAYKEYCEEVANLVQFYKLKMEIFERNSTGEWEAVLAPTGNFFKAMIMVEEEAFVYAVSIQNKLKREFNVENNYTGNYREYALKFSAFLTKYHRR